MVEGKQFDVDVDADRVALVKLIKNRFIKRLENTKEEYKDLASVWVAKIVMQKRKIKITHEFDPPGDDSGRAINTYEPFDKRDYESFEDFLEREYNGENAATFISGGGLRHLSYMDEFRNLTEDWSIEQFRTVLMNLLKEKHPTLLSIYSELNTSHDSLFSDDPIYKIERLRVEFDSELGDFVISEVPHNLMNELFPVKLHILLKRGYEKAKLEIEEEKKEKQSIQEQAETEREVAESTWEIIQKQYELRYREKIPSRIDGNNYEKLLQLINIYFKREEDIEKIHLIGKHLSYKFSNSVSRKLMKYSPPN